MNARERFHETMRFGAPDRFCYYEWHGYWPDTVARWYDEGLEEAVGMDALLKLVLIFFQLALSPLSFSCICSKTDESNGLATLIPDYSHFHICGEWSSILSHVLYWPRELASTFGLLDERNHVGLHLLFSVEHANLFTNQFMPRIVAVHRGPRRIDEPNGSIEINHGNSLPRLFSDLYETS